MGNVIMDDSIIDIHSHIVYGIDDGAYTIKRADNQMIEGEAEGAYAGCAFCFRAYVMKKGHFSIRTGGANERGQLLSQ